MTTFLKLFFYHKNLRFVSLFYHTGFSSMEHYLKFKNIHSNVIVRDFSIRIDGCHRFCTFHAFLTFGVTRIK